MYIRQELLKKEKIMLTDKQEKLLEVMKNFENLKQQMKELKPQLLELLEEVGVGTYFQDPGTQIVYKVTVPTGRFTYFDAIDYDRTKKVEERSGALSKKEAIANGFNL